ncbi:MAG: ChrR family anti-sigma-E factor [Alphaproteobacteria bacterium]|nr:ChrR family anti-sigma-E factor [Alphaproteobacteria bacterium]
MSRHTAPDELLLDYAAGALPEGPALAVALHVALDPAARRTVDRLGALAGALLDGEDAPAVDEASLERLLARLDGMAVEPQPVPVVPRPGFDWAPPALVRYLDPGARWRRKLGGFEEIPLTMRADSHRVSLLRLEPGHGLPVHRHVGEELTVVLQGGFTDAMGSYGPGDFAVGPGAQEHEPIADPGEACIALIVLQKPIVLTGPLGRWFNPLVRRGLI